MCTVNDVIKSDDNSGPSSKFRPDKALQLPKSVFGKHERRCLQQWFEDFKWLCYDMQMDSVFCHYCITHQEKLTTEHNKDPAYLTTGFRNWKKALKCFKEHELSKCHTAALTYETVVPKC